MGRKEKFGYWCKLYKDKICDGCMDCLEKPEPYVYKKTDVWNVWMDSDERPKLVKHENGKIVIKEVK